MALLPTPAPPSTTSLILSRSAMFTAWSHRSKLTSCTTTARMPPQEGIGFGERSKSLVHLPRTRYDRLAFSRPAPPSLFVQRMLIRLPAAVLWARIVVRSESAMVAVAPRDRSIVIDAGPRQTRFSARPRRPTTSPFTYPFYVAPWRGSCILLGGKSRPPVGLATRIKIPVGRREQSYCFLARTKHVASSGTELCEGDGNSIRVSAW